MNYIFCEKPQLLYHQSLKAVQKQEEKNGFARYMDMNLQCITQKNNYTVHLHLNLFISWHIATRGEKDAIS